MDDRNPSSLADFEKSIQHIEQLGKGLVTSVANAHAERASLAYQAEWHIRGITYHLRRCFQHYSRFVSDVAARAGSGASVIIMFTPDYQAMLFELYALVNLCKIALDNLRLYLAPLFVPSSHLPKSIRDIVEAGSDCPIFQKLSGQPLLEYLMDLRNCLVHFRSFATSDNALICEENSTDCLLQESDLFLTPMARADFRRVGENGISVNVLLPDRIFENKGTSTKRVAQFSFEERLSLVSMARDFAHMTVGAIAGTLKLLATVDTPQFTFTAKNVMKLNAERI